MRGPVLQGGRRCPPFFSPAATSAEIHPASIHPPCGVPPLPGLHITPPFFRTRSTPPALLTQEAYAIRAFRRPGGAGMRKEIGRWSGKCGRVGYSGSGPFSRS